MGGGGSKPAALPPGVTFSGLGVRIAPTASCPGGVKKDTGPGPYPTTGLAASTGLSRSIVETKARVFKDPPTLPTFGLKIPANVSVSSVTLTRRTGQEDGTNPNYSPLSKVFIKLSMPVSLSYTNNPEGSLDMITTSADTMTVYYPSPLRIENVQHDAVLSIGDAALGSDLVILIPLAASNDTNPGTAILDRIAPFIRSTLGGTEVKNTRAIDQTQGAQPVTVGVEDRCTGATSQLSVEAVGAKRDTAQKELSALESEEWNTKVNKYYPSIGVNSWQGRDAADAANDSRSWQNQPQAKILFAKMRATRAKLDGYNAAMTKVADLAKQATEKNMNDFIENELAKSQMVACNDTNVSTGSDWSLDKLMPVDEKSLAQGPYYTWTTPKYEQFVVSDTTCERKLAWKQAPGGRRYIMFTNPALISQSALVSIRTLPYTEPSKAIEGLGVFWYKVGPCINCKKVLPGGAEYLKQQQAKEAAGQNSAQDLVQILFYFLGGLLVAIGVYLGVKFAFSDSIRQVPRVGENIGLATKSGLETFWGWIKSIFSSLGGGGGGTAAVPEGLPLPPQLKAASLISKLGKK